MSSLMSSNVLSNVLLNVLTNVFSNALTNFLSNVLLDTLFLETFITLLWFLEMKSCGPVQYQVNICSSLDSLSKRGRRR